MIVSDATENTIRKGGSFILESDDSSGGAYLEQRYPSRSSIEKHCRAYTLDGRFLGIQRLNPENGRWHPEKVFL